MTLATIFGYWLAHKYWNAIQVIVAIWIQRLGHERWCSFCFINWSLGLGTLRNHSRSLTHLWCLYREEAPRPRAEGPCSHSSSESQLRVPVSTIRGYWSNPFRWLDEVPSDSSNTQPLSFPSWGPRNYGQFHLYCDIEFMSQIKWLF